MTRHPFTYLPEYFQTTEMHGCSVRLELDVLRQFWLHFTEGWVVS